ncbi:hypothetical protein KBY82_14275 [Cyanobium sp. AMD-g]|nr:hypothetical protein [Cyanobium sp. AMD-g]
MADEIPTAMDGLNRRARRFTVTEPSLIPSLWVMAGAAVTVAGSSPLMQI